MCDSMISETSELLVVKKGEAVLESLIHELVKNELEYIVLSLLLNKPRCGTDIIKTIHAKFGLLLSPGTVYPLLHELERRGLAEHEQSKKVKIYRPVKGMRKNISQMLEARVSAMRRIIDFLQWGSESSG